MLRRLTERRGRDRAAPLARRDRGGRRRPTAHRVLRRRRPVPHGRHADRLQPDRGPGHSFDRIYVLGDGLLNVAEAKPGDRDYNGGRWMVLPVTWAAGGHAGPADERRAGGGLRRRRHADDRVVAGEAVRVPGDPRPGTLSRGGGSPWACPRRSPTGAAGRQQRGQGP